MGISAALGAAQLSCSSRQRTEAHAGIAEDFARLLQTDRQSPEFAELWEIVDTYLTAALETERRVER